LYGWPYPRRRVRRNGPDATCGQYCSIHRANGPRARDCGRPRDVFFVRLRLMADTHTTSDADLRGTAFHEAGHCVTAIVHGLSIRYVTIVPGKRKSALGPIMSGRTLIRGPKLPQTIEQEHAESNSLLMVRYAGAFCESAAAGKPVDPSTVAADHKAAKDTLAFRLGCDGDSATVQSALRNLYLETAKFLASPKILRAVQRVANALLERHTLTGREVRRIVFQESDDGPNA
jgi:hypothetical protein